MWPGVAVVVAQFVELGLEFPKCFWSGFCSEPLFEGLVESLDFALGLGVVFASVFLSDAVAGGEVFVGVFAACAAGGEDLAVVGEGGVGRPVGGDQVIERVHDALSGDGVMAGQ